MKMDIGALSLGHDGFGQSTNPFGDMALSEREVVSGGPITPCIGSSTSSSR